MYGIFVPADVDEYSSETESGTLFTCTQQHDSDPSILEPKTDSPAIESRYIFKQIYELKGTNTYFLDPIWKKERL